MLSNQHFKLPVPALRHVFLRIARSEEHPLVVGAVKSNIG